MNRRILLISTAGIVIAATAAIVATAEQNRGPAFIPGDQPVTEDQVKQKLTSEGYTNIQIAREGRYFEAIGTKDGKVGSVAVDSQTGRLRGGEDDDDD